MKANSNHLTPITRIALCALALASFSSMASADREARRLAYTPVDEGGVAVVVEPSSVDALTIIADKGPFVVQGLCSDPNQTAALRKELAKTGRYGDISVITFDGKHFPYADNVVNLLRYESLSVSAADLFRVVRPLGALVGASEIITKPWPTDIDEWTHYLHGPDNNAVAQDSVVAAPRGIQWVAEPRWGRSHEQMASMSVAVTARGRLFFINDEGPLDSLRLPAEWKLIARDAFNGVLLWKRDIPVWTDHLRHFRSGPTHLQRRLVADDQDVYVTLGLDAPVTQLDAATGETKRTYDDTKWAEEIIVNDGVLYLIVGTSEINRKGEGLHERREPAPRKERFVVAFDTDSGKQLWKNAFPGDEFVMPMSLTVRGDSAYYQTTKTVVRVDAKTGDQRWSMPRRTPLKRIAWSAPTVVATDDVLLVSDRIVDSKIEPAKGGIEWGVGGWDVSGIPRKSKTQMIAYDTATGRELWNAPTSEQYNSPTDVFVVDGVAYIGNGLECHDIKSGEIVKKLTISGDSVGMGHHRCYRDKASVNYIFTGHSGVEMVSLEDGWQGNNSWIRGACQYGVMPANGLLYAPPDACACFPRSKLAGFFAATTKSGPTGGMGKVAPGALEKGPAFASDFRSADSADKPASEEDWPAYRRNVDRGGAVDTTLPDAPTRKWSTDIGRRLTQPISVGDTVFVAATDAHTIHALDAATGKSKWAFIADARIDSAPSFYKNRLYFGCADGRVYCLVVDSGRLVWRHRIAPREALIGSYGQLESIWPVHGAVLIQNDTVYASAGRSSYLDGGIRLCALHPISGELKAEHTLSHIDPETGKQTGFESRKELHNDIEGTVTDVLTGDGESVFLKHFRFDADLNPVEELKPHLFSITGLLGEDWFIRSYWLLGVDVGAGYGGWAGMGNQVPAGRILCFDDDRVFGYGRQQYAAGKTGHHADAAYLHARKKDLQVVKYAGKTRTKSKGGSKSPTPEFLWTKDDTLITRAMTLAGDKLVIAGPPDMGARNEKEISFVDEAEAVARFRGERGVYLRVLAAGTGETISEKKLDAAPVFDGMIAANGRLFIATRDGDLQCWGQ